MAPATQLQLHDDDTENQTHEPWVTRARQEAKIIRRGPRTDSGDRKVEAVLVDPLERELAPALLIIGGGVHQYEKWPGPRADVKII